MKKKLLTFVLAASFGISTVTYGFEQDDLFNYATNSDSVTECEITYTENSRYCVNIPLRLSNLSYEEYTFTASYINILDTEQVSVYVTNGNGEVELSDGKGHTLTMQLAGNSDYFDSNRVATFYDLDETSQYSMRGQMLTSGHAGYYTGTATFRVSLEAKN